MRAYWLALDIGYYIGLPLLWYVLPATWWCLRQLSRPCVFLWLILVFGCASPPAREPVPALPLSCGADCGGEGGDILDTIWPGQVLY